MSAGMAQRGAGTLLLALCLLAPCGARAGVAEFLAGCVAEAADLRRLPATLAAAGLVETNPANGPAGPAIAQAPDGRRLWSAPGTGEGRGDAFTGYTSAGSGRPFEVCWHVSRPGESAAVALDRLRRRFPPLDGAPETGAEFFYGGFKRWRARAGTAEVIIGVSWGMRERPEKGTGFLYVVKPVP